MTLEFQPIEHASQWQIAADLANTMRPEGKYTGPQLELYAREVPPGKLSSRHLAMHEGRPIAYLRTLQCFWFADQSRCNIGIYTPPGPKRSEVLASGLSFINALAHQNGMTLMCATLRSDDEDVIDFYASQGFRRGQVNSVSSLDISQFSATKYQVLLDSLNESGYQLMSVPEFASLFPEDWIRRLYEFDMELSKDVPMPEPFEGIPYETFENMTLSEATRLDAYWLALKDGEIAGQTQINPSMADTVTAGTGLTGVRRAYRRQGLATALKITAISWAREAGIRTIFTDNEENNPMYQLNLDLGYRHVRDMIEFTCAVRA